MAGHYVKEIASERHVSCSALDHLFKRQRLETQKELTKYSDVSTPYGKLLEEISLPNEAAGAEPYQWTIVNPFALLYVLCSRSCHFAAFLAHCVSGLIARVVLYTDETNSGNQLRPDLKGEVQCFYWTFAEFPDWYRARHHGWFVFAYLELGNQREVLGDISGVCRTMLQKFWSPHRASFIHGVRLSRCLAHDPEAKFTLRAHLLCFLQDGKAFKELNSTKGGGGWHCCQWCWNHHLNSPPLPYIPQDPHPPNIHQKMWTCTPPYPGARAPGYRVGCIASPHFLVYRWGGVQVHIFWGVGGGDPGRIPSYIFLYDGAKMW